VEIRTIPREDELFVIGDVHGCADELEELLDRLPLTKRSQIVFIGDYIDRGPDSRRVIDKLIELKQRHTVYPLMGNHELSLIEFLDEPASSLAARFLLNGGGATLHSYSDRPGAFDLPTDHVELIRNLAAGFCSPSYFFVHAGLPDVPIAELRCPEHMESMLWIRRDFFNSAFTWEKLIVHGHTPRDEVDFAPGRINIDTGWFEKDWRCDWKFDETRFPDGVSFYLAAVFDPTDGEGAAGECTFGLELPHMVVVIDEWRARYIEVARERGFAVIDALGHFHGHGHNYENVSNPYYDVADPTTWFSDCIHPNDRGHSELRRLFYEAIDPEYAVVD